MYAINELVRSSLATHLRIDPTAIKDDQHLFTDLRLKPLDLVWIAMVVETLELGAGEFPMEKLVDLDTVEDLIDVFEDWSAQRDTFEEIDVYVSERDPIPDWR